MDSLCGMIDQLKAGWRRIARHLDASFTPEAERRWREQQARTAMILNLVQMVNSTLELDEVVDHIRKGMMTVIPGSHCGFYLVADDRFLPAGSDDHSIKNDPLALQAIAGQKPIACFDAENDPLTYKASIRRFGIKSILAVPLVVQGQVLAIVYVSTHNRRHVFSQEEIDLISGMGNVMGLAIKNALLYRKAEQLAVLQERARLSREMHDDLAQRLGALQLVASLTGDLLANDQITQAQASVLKLQDMVSQAYADVREDIFNLRTGGAPELGFLPVVREYLADYRTRYGVQVQLEADASVEPDLTGRVQVQALRIIQEALTNVRKHAQADRVEVRVARDGDCVRISVEDNGCGFDPAAAQAPGRRYFGLEVLSERAASVGGILTIDSHVGQGTRISFRAPLAPERGHE